MRKYKTYAVTSAAQQATVLAQIAQSLASGQWSSQYYLADNHPNRPAGSKTINQTVNARGTLGPANHSALRSPNSMYMEIVRGWTGKAQFQDVNGGEVWYCGGTTGRASGNLTMARYSLATDSFDHWQADSALDAANSVFGIWGAPHNFDAAAIADGKIYRDLPPYDGASWDPVPYRGLGIWDTATKTGTVAVHMLGGSGDGFFPVEYFPGMGAAGSILTFVRGHHIRRFDLATSSWAALIENGPSGLEIGPLCHHNGKIYFAQSIGTAFYEMSWNGSAASFAAKAPVPTTVSTGGVDGVVTQAVMCSIGSNLYCFAANTRTVYKFDGTSWTVASTFPWAANAYDGCFTVAAISTLGVAMLIRTKTNLDSEALLWKP